jgi:hypothetical protein
MRWLNVNAFVFSATRRAWEAVSRIGQRGTGPGLGREPR